MAVLFSFLMVLYLEELDIILLFENQDSSTRYVFD